MEKSGGDVFGFGAEQGLAQGMRTMAMMWTALWRAAFIVAGEAMRLGFVPPK